MIALGAVLAHALNSDVQQRYIDTAKTDATVLTQVGVQPLFSASQMSDGLTAGDIALVDERLQGASVSKEVRRLKVWSRSGTIIYSDNHSLIGRTFPIDDDLKDALAGASSASITDGHDEENTGDNLAGPLIQVYVPLVFLGSSSPSGAFELYLPYAPVQAAINSESQQIYVYLAAGLTLCYLSMFPIVLLAIRWQRRAEAAAMANVAALERLNKLKTEFLVGISHQFRTALVGIEGFSELIQDSDHLDPTDVKAFAEDINDDAQRLDVAFKKMLELDRAEAGGSVLPPDGIDLERVIKDVVRVTHPSGDGEQPAHTTHTNGANG